MDKIILPIKAKHFHNAVYLDGNNCPIANAAKEFFNVVERHVNEGVDMLHIGLGTGKKTYVHEVYGVDRFDSDMHYAKLENYNDQIILQLELIPYVNND